MELIKQVVIIRVSNDKLQETLKILDLISNPDISCKDIKLIRLMVEGHVIKKIDNKKGEAYGKDTD
ncbi:hypothetical protein [uncultured Clostridium sp.]|uniref:hypothetical protein n=1 Tax=uncultured Clostridium sp. TaxID=59620 RepID=UPI0025FEC030|nr:hypothetical protein [uncultured Clostridium sp.]